MRFSADRVTAARMLVRVESGAFSSRLLASGAAKPVRARVLGVLRWLRVLDAVLSPLCRREFESLDPEVRASLRIGLLEVIDLGVPHQIATDGAVHLVRRLGRSSAAGMVNAVMRRATARWSEVLETASDDLRLAHPEWIARRWCSFFGDGEGVDAMRSAQAPPETWVWFHERSRATAIAKRGIDLVRHPWCPGAWAANEAVGELLAEVTSGHAYAQDPSSQIVAHLAHAVRDPGGSVVDVCAAPGGKTALIARLGGSGDVVAADLRVARVRLIAPLAERAGGILTVAADATQSPFREGCWNVVLVDAPCSGTGTFRRHPELKWRLELAVIPKLAERQRDILTGSWPLAAAGGVLLYATCSIEPEENEEHFRRLPEGWTVIDLAALLPEGVPALTTSAGGIRILPNPFGDGFTVHGFRRTA